MQNDDNEYYYKRGGDPDKITKNESIIDTVRVFGSLTVGTTLIGVIGFIYGVFNQPIKYTKRDSDDLKPKQIELHMQDVKCGQIKCEGEVFDYQAAEKEIQPRVIKTES